MTRALVLGASGFLGRHAVRALTGDGMTVVQGPRREVLDLATADYDEVRALVRGASPDLVVNATGAVSGSPEQLERANPGVARALVEACAHVAPGARLVHLGSMAEYGPGHGEPIRESDPAQPISPYGRAKLSATEVVLAAAGAGTPDVVVLRVANPVGAGQPLDSLLGSVARQVAADRAADVEVGPLNGFRDFVSARDVGRAIVAAARARFPAGESRVVNIGTGRVLPVRDVVAGLLRLSGSTGRLVEGALQGSARSAEVRVIVADVGRAARLLDWQSQDGIQAALEQVLLGAGLAVAVESAAARVPAQGGPGAAEAR